MSFVCLINEIVLIFIMIADQSIELNEDAGSPSLLKRVPTVQFFHPYLKCFGCFTILEETLILLSIISAHKLFSS